MGMTRIEHVQLSLGERQSSQTGGVTYVIVTHLIDVTHVIESVVDIRVFVCLFVLSCFPPFI